MKTCTVTDSGIRVERLSQTAFPPGTASYFIGGGGPSPRPGPNSPKAWLGTHVCLGCERLNPRWGGWVEFVTSKQAFAVRQTERELGMLMANGDYSGEFISCLLRQEFFNVAVQPGQKVSEGQR